MIILSNLDSSMESTYTVARLCWLDFSEKICKMGEKAKIQECDLTLGNDLLYMPMIINYGAWMYIVSIIIIIIFVSIIKKMMIQ